jgi:hypothetical protein
MLNTKINSKRNTLTIFPTSVHNASMYLHFMYAMLHTNNVHLIMSAAGAAGIDCAVRATLLDRSLQAQRRRYRAPLSLRVGEHPL